MRIANYLDNRKKAKIVLQLNKDKKEINDALVKIIHDYADLLQVVEKLLKPPRYVSAKFDDVARVLIKQGIYKKGEMPGSYEALLKEDLGNIEI